MSTEKVQHEYGADEIQILEGLEAVRKRRECILEVHRQGDSTILSMR